MSAEFPGGSTQLDFFRIFHEIRDRMRTVVEMPDRLERLFIRLCMQNQGHLAKKKRRVFHMLDDATISRLEAAVRNVMNPDAHREK